jgi:hypothetical protein
VTLDLKWNLFMGVHLRIENPDGSTLWDPPPVASTTEHTQPGLLSFESFGPTAASMFVDNISNSAVPEPTSAAASLIGGGVAMLDVMRRRRRAHMKGHV